MGEVAAQAESLFIKVTGAYLQTTPVQQERPSRVVTKLQAASRANIGCGIPATEADSYERKICISHIKVLTSGMLAGSFYTRFLQRCRLRFSLAMSELARDQRMPA